MNVGARVVLASEARAARQERVQSLGLLVLGPSMLSRV